MNILIKNGLTVTPDGMVEQDVYIEDSTIVKIGKNIDAATDKVIDAEGLAVMAGFVDMHCHLRDPGQEYKEDIDSGTAAALQGGFTTVACMPNTAPPLDSPALIKYVVGKAAEVDNARVLPIGCITKGMKGNELAEMGLMQEAGAIAFSDDGRPVENGNTMRLALEYAKGIDALIISHCEDKSLLADGVVNEGMNATIAGLKGITRAAEESMVAREILLAAALDARVHIAHVSTKNSVRLIREVKKWGVKVTCETCPHYIAATDEEILSYNTYAKINPPLRTDDDVAAVIEGLKDGTIDAIATDHAPHHEDEKNVGFDYAPFGTSGFETAFGVCYTYLVEAGHLDIVELSKLMSENPARILRCGGGLLQEGQRADIAIADLNEEYTVDRNKFVSKGKNSVFDGWKLKGKIKHVLVEGRIKEIK